jgi:hypothetical protein
MSTLGLQGCFIPLTGMHNGKEKLPHWKDEQCRSIQHCSFLKSAFEGTMRCWMEQANVGREHFEQMSVGNNSMFIVDSAYFIYIYIYIRSRKLRFRTVRDPPRWPRDTLLSTKVDTKFHRQVAVAQSGHRVYIYIYIPPFYLSLWHK